MPSEREAPQCSATPLADLRKGALEHYEKVSMNACDWLSTIPRAINFYFDAQEAAPAAALPSAPLTEDAAIAGHFPMPSTDTALLDALEARGVVSIYFADGSQLNPGSQSLRAALTPGGADHDGT